MGDARSDQNPDEHLDPLTTNPSAIVPSYFTKLSRAEVHIARLDELVTVYRDSHPYEVVRPTDSDPNFRVRFTSTATNTEIPLLIGDAVYNIHTALHHLNAALVPPARRHHVMFPILWKDVWVELENEDREQRRGRERWDSVTRGVKDEAVTILKRIQPPANLNNSDPEVHMLTLLNRLSNTDRHRALNPVISGLDDICVGLTRSDGTTHELSEQFSNDRRFGMVRDGGLIHLEPDEVDVSSFVGRAQVVVRLSSPEGDLVLPGSLLRLLEWIRTNVVFPLSQYEYSG